MATVVKSKVMIPKFEDHKIFEIKITRSQRKNDPKNEDHKKAQDQNHVITKLDEIKIT